MELSMSVPRRAALSRDRCPRQRWRTQLALPAVALVLSLLPACGNWITTDINGAVGAKTNTAHSVILVLRVCSGAVNHVELYPPHTGPRTEPDQPIGIWHATAPISHNTVLNLNQPGPTWQVRRDPGHLRPGTRYGVLAHGEDDEELTQLDFRPAQLEALPAGHVRFNGRGMQEEKFAHLAWCNWS